MKVNDVDEFKKIEKDLLRKIDQSKDELNFYEKCFFSSKTKTEKNKYFEIVNRIKSGIKIYDQNLLDFYYENNM